MSARRKSVEQDLTEIDRFRGRGMAKVLHARAAALALIRRYFDEQGFLEVQTPTWVKAPGTDVYIDPMRSEDGFLITSPEFQMKRLLASGLPKIYQIAHVFRKGEQGQLHEGEFTMLEWYRTRAGYEATQRDTEILTSTVIQALSGSLNLKTPLGAVGTVSTVQCKPPFERITVRQAFKQYAGIDDVSDLAASDENQYFDLLVGKVEPALADKKRPVFLLDYPLSQAALARACPRAPGYAERFELYLAGVELCNGYGELTDAKEQRARFIADNKRRKSKKLPHLPLDEKFLSALEQGLPPCTGNALGLDRLLMLALGKRSLDQVIAFPKSQL
ncbi:MAG TPA: EF-P lysine aminoacylase EpmA [Polyangiaceae bacterium]|nr:EF-P lysine aminoacylase EpmA [Polyangiaceae bacterium]